MCSICGCSSNVPSNHSHHHERGEEHHHGQENAVPSDFCQSSPPTTRALKKTTIQIEEQILARNNKTAKANRDWFASQGILAINIMSSPGSGKTTFLEQTLLEVGTELKISVIEGDQETSLDTQRIQATGCSAVQINTGAGCHLDAEMVKKGLSRLSPPKNSVIVIENVGNLVCPALFDLGEMAKVLIFSVTEGEDKPLKYPFMFRSVDILVINKIDLLPYLSFDLDKSLAYAGQINQKLKVFKVSASSGEGMAEWFDWLRTSMKASA